MKTTRQQILDHLRTRRTTTAMEIARVLRMTPANARHHLNSLAGEGVIEAVGQLSPGGKGRPSRLYRLADPAQRHSLDNLTCALLEELVSRLPAEEQEAALERLARRLGGSKTTPAPEQEPAPVRPLSQRLYAAVHRLNELHYSARWEAHRQAPRLILGRCPYAAIIDRHPELCVMDAHLLEGLAGAPVRQIARLEPDGQGEPQCVFLIRQDA
jgi:predicted ArsR family transcriptional regulator